jgi:pentatricopeptide repeat protein
VELLEDAYRAGVAVGRQRVVRALQLCARTRDTELVDKMADLSARLLPRDRVVRNSIVGAYANVDSGTQKPAGAMEAMEAVKLAHVAPNRVTWNTLVASHAKAGQRGQALTALDRMQEAGFLPDCITFNTLIKAHVAIGDLDDALATFELMKARRIKPNERTYSTLISGHLKHGHNEKATELLREMEGRRIAPSLMTLTSFIYANCKANALDASQRILERLNEEGQQPNRVTYTAIIEGMCRNGLGVQANLVFNEMVDRHGLAPDVLTYTSLLKGTEGQPERAWSLYQDMRTRGVIPDAIFYRDLIRTQRQSADDATLNQLVDETINAGARIAPKMTAVDCKRLLRVLSARPASALHAWRAMLRAQLPLDRDLLDVAAQVVQTGGNAEARAEHEAAERQFAQQQNEDRYA